MEKEEPKPEVTQDAEMADDTQQKDVVPEGEGNAEQKDVTPEGEGTTEEPAPVGKPIGPIVNQQWSSTIQEMGFSRPVSEKALLFSGNTSVEAAMDWIQQHQEDADFETEEFLAEDPSERDPNKPKLSKEERVQAAVDLQKRIRAKREAEDKKIAEEREIHRIQSTKELQKAKRIMEDQQTAIRLEMERKEKKEFIMEKKRMEEVLKKVR